MDTLDPSTVIDDDKTNSQDLEMHEKPSKNHQAPECLIEEESWEVKTIERELVALLCFPKSVSRMDPGRAGSLLNGRTS